MKNTNPFSYSDIFSFLLVTILLLCPAATSKGQDPAINESIAKHRKGDLIVKAKKGQEVTVEQLRHEFWFGCAIPNSLAENSMSEANKKKFKEEFIKHFNCAVTENAVNGNHGEIKAKRICYCGLHPELVKKIISPRGQPFSGGKSNTFNPG